MELMTLPPSPSKTEKDDYAISVIEDVRKRLNEKHNAELQQQVPLTKKKETALELKYRRFIFSVVNQLFDVAAVSVNVRQSINDMCWEFVDKLLDDEIKTARQEARREVIEEIRQIISDDDEGYINEEIRHARNRMKHSLITQLTHK
jgi:hypothetical protein